MIIFVFLTSVLLVALVSYLKKAYSRFNDFEVAHYTPFPVLGNAHYLVFRTHHVAVDNKILYDEFKNERFTGRYELTQPLIVVHDPELIKKVTVKDFEHFLDHRHIVDDEVDTLFGRALFCLRGKEWKDMRSTLSPAFTSSKIKNMVPFMVDVNKQMIDHLKERLDASNTDYCDVDIKDVTTRYANDVIATCAFGVKVNSHEDETNDFYMHGRSSASFDLRKILVFFGYNAFPAILKKMDIRLFKEETSQFFKSLVLTTMDTRETQNIFRPDMIQLLIEAKNGKLVHDSTKPKDEEVGFATVEESDVGKRIVNTEWKDDDLIAQAFFFFLAGFETVSSTMALLFHELAAHPETQERVYQEILDAEAKFGGKLDHNTIQSMKYLDMCLSEALRLWPAVVGLDRRCIKDYNIGKPNDKAKKDYVIRKGENLTIPTYAIHRDPQYYPNPDKFEPERFSDENKDKINPFTYMPFGLGPRNCIGSRFALIEIKVMAYQFLQQFKVSVCKETVYPVVLAPEYFTIVIKGGHTLRLSNRKQKTN